MRSFLVAAAVFVAAAFSPSASNAQDAPKFVVDPTWPRDLPKDWITGQLGGVCVDARDNVYVVNRRNLTDEEKQTSISAPSIIKFDVAGEVAASWGDETTVPGSIHGCVVDGDNNIYVGGNSDGVIQKYDQSGKLLLQIGTRGKFNSVDGKRTGIGTQQREGPAPYALGNSSRSRKWRHLCLGWVRQSSRCGVRQSWSVPASMGPAGDR